LTAPSIPAAGRVRATGSQDSLDDAGRWILLGAAAAHVGSLPRPSPRPPGWAAYTGPTRAHCPPLVAAERWGVEVRRGGTLPVTGEGSRAGVRPLGGGGVPAGFGGDSRTGHGARQPARRARKTAERRAASLGRRLRGGWAEWEARESTRLGSTDSVRFRRENHERMELVEAVKKQDVEKVEVRRPLEAGSSTEFGPSRGVCLGLGQWALEAVVARPIRPCCVESSPHVRHQSGNCDAACRRTSVPVRTSSSVTRTLPCRLAESHNFSLSPSLAIAVPATF
jgi:hypothetical protein